MDGTIYLDNELFDGTIDFLEKVKKKQGRYLFVTNNSSKSVSAYVEKLKNIGINATEDDFLTSTEATVLYIKNNYPEKKFYSLGTKSFTDIASGYNAGIDTVLVLSGEGTVEDAKSTDKKPTYIMKNIRELCDKI